MKDLALIVAYSANRCIGKDGGIPWRSKPDMQRFKQITSRPQHRAVIMGRKTWDSLPAKFRPLPNRTNIVVSSRVQSADMIEGTVWVPRPEMALEAADEVCACPMVMGGQTLYEWALPRATILYLTEITAEIHGDTFFPEVDEDRFIEVERRQPSDDNILFRTLVRRR